MSDFNISLLVLATAGTMLSFVTKQQAIAWTTVISIIILIIFGHDI